MVRKPPEKERQKSRKTNVPPPQNAKPATSEAPTHPAEPATIAGPLPDGRLTAMVSAVLVLLVAIVFAQLRTHQFLNYDDDVYVTANPHVKTGLTAGGIEWAFTSTNINWHPLTWISHMIDVSLFGLNAGPQLLVNAGLHAVNTVLLLLFLLAATRKLWRSAFVAALFAVHPLHVESVAWLSERKDVLSTLFFLLTLLLYVRWTQKRSIALYAGVMAAFVLGLMAKGMLVTLPFVLLLLDVWPLRRLANFDFASIRKVVVEKLPLFAIDVPAVVVTYFAQRSGGAVADIEKVRPLAKLTNPLISYAAYIGKTFWPTGLAIPYPYRQVVTPLEAFVSIALLIALTVVAVKTHNTRPWLFTGWFWFAGTLVPVIGIVQIGAQSMADRYTYIPLIGLFIALTWLAAEAVEKWPAVRFGAWPVAAAVVIALAFAAHVQAGYWRNSEALFRHSLAVTTDNVYAHIGLGTTLLDEKHDAPAALREFQAAATIFPKSAAAHHDLGAAYGALGRYDDAAREYRRAIELEPTPQRYQQLATVEMKLGNKAAAAQMLTRASAAQGDPAALAMEAMERGDAATAFAKFAEAVQMRPKSPELRNDYAAALAKAGRDDEAIQQYQEAIKLSPYLYDAHMNLGAILSRHDRNEEAITEFETAGQLQPKSTEPHIYLALALAQAGQKADAAREAQAALAIDEKTANEQLTNAVRLPPSPQNLRQFIASMQAR